MWRTHRIGQFQRKDRVPLRPLTFEIQALDRRFGRNLPVPLNLKRADVLDVQAVGLPLSARFAGGGLRVKRTPSFQRYSTVLNSTW